MLIISSLADAENACRQYSPSRVISLVSEDEIAPGFCGVDPARHLLLHVSNESCAKSITSAARERAEKIIEFINGWDRNGNILVHCNRGVARSTAAAFVVLCMLEPNSDEAELMKRLRKVAPYADPCPLLITYADEILGRDGCMEDAVDDLGPPAPAISAPTVAIEIAA